MGEKKEKQQKTRDLENTTKMISDTVVFSFSCPVCVSSVFLMHLRGQIADLSEM